jgi:hypothetical protein
MITIGSATKAGSARSVAGRAGDIMRVATMGETLPQGERIGRFALNAVVAREEGEHNAIYCRRSVPAR